MSTAIVWLRQDLRTQDNPALFEASIAHDAVIPVYILEESNENIWPIGSAQRWWLHHSLTSLQSELSKLGSPLILRKGNCLKELQKLIKESDADTVYWNRCYEPHAILRDKKIKTEIKNINIEVESFNGSLFNEPWNIMNKQGDYFKVYTPYWKHCLKTQPIRNILSTQKKLKCFSHSKSDDLKKWNLLPQNPNWTKDFNQYHQPGTAGAHKRLEHFLMEHISQYPNNRDFPHLDVTSHLSPHLHFGEISPTQIWHAVQTAATEEKINDAAIERFYSQLGWREFSYYLLYHFPEFPSDNFRSQFNKFKWNNNKNDLKKWQQGLTGFPIVDAGMRELWHSGIMHNRVRMIAASFLIKDLLIDWRKGEEWFWDTLVDADLANNSAGWQWVAGSGADAAPYFRIFNPITQGQKFDPQGLYIKKWIPELRDLPVEYIHEPWLSPQKINYPAPMVNHKLAREEALKQYRSIKSST